MATYNKYSNSQGEFCQVRGYLGVNEETGEKVECRKRGFQTKKEATAYYKEEQKKFLVGDRFKQNKRYTFKELYHEWASIYKNDVEISTFERNKDYFNLHILPAFGNIYIDKLSPKRIQAQVNDWYPQFAQYRRLFNNTKRVLKYAVDQGYIRENPCDKVHIPKKKLSYDTIDENKKKFYSRDELEDVLKSLSQMKTKRWYAFYRLLAFSGMRSEEIRALTWHDIDYKAKTINIDKAIARGKKVNKKRTQYLKGTKNDQSTRVISIDDKTLNILKSWKSEQSKTLTKLGFNIFNKNQLVFSQYKDNSYMNHSEPRNALSKVCKKYGLPMLNMHGFRHTHATLLADAGIPLKNAMERLGHKDLEMTLNVYTHVSKDSRDKSAQIFANYANF
ncbi:tyrosine-type recombinase/integrase [Aerococcus loyolae]